MKVYISWSGERSLLVAEALRDWLPMVLNAVKPYVTSKDIDKGAAWDTEIMTNLSDSKMGIVCVTAENVEKPWLLFESGALSRAVAGKGLVCTYLLDHRPTDLAPPLGRFQHTIANEKDTHALVETIRKQLGEHAVAPDVLRVSVPRLWGVLDELLRKIPAAGVQRPKRSTDEILEEILEHVRSGSPSLPVDLERAGDNRRGGTSGPDLRAYWVSRALSRGRFEGGTHYRRLASAAERRCDGVGTAKGYFGCPACVRHARTSSDTIFLAASARRELRDVLDALPPPTYNELEDPDEAS